MDVKVMTYFVLALLLASTPGCTTEAVRDRVLAQELEDSGDYAGARDARLRDLDRVMNEGLRPDLKRFTVMMATYELGRATGYTCDYSGGERLLREALRQSYEVEERFSHRTAMLSELARLTLDAGNPAASAGFHEQALERLDRSGYDRVDPLAVADFLGSYAEALAASGEAAKAQAAYGRAQTLRDQNPGGAAVFHAKRYRDVCGVAP